MTEFHEGDLIEVSMQARLVPARGTFRSLALQYDETVDGHEVLTDLNWLLARGLKATLIERAPTLPTKPGHYLDRDNDLWTLHVDGSWRSHLTGGDQGARTVRDYAPFVRLEPVRGSEL